LESLVNMHQNSIHWSRKWIHSFKTKLYSFVTLKAYYNYGFGLLSNEFYVNYCGLFQSGHQILGILQEIGNGNFGFMPSILICWIF
jgi:hypothetical protein